MRAVLCTADQNLLNPETNLIVSVLRIFSPTCLSFCVSFKCDRACLFSFGLMTSNCETTRENDLFSLACALRTQLCERVFSAPQSTRILYRERMPLFWSHQRTLPLSQLMGTFYSIWRGVGQSPREVICVRCSRCRQNVNHLRVSKHSHTRYP